MVPLGWSLGCLRQSSPLGAAVAQCTAVGLGGPTFSPREQLRLREGERREHRRGWRNGGGHTTNFETRGVGSKRWDFPMGFPSTLGMCQN